MKKCKCGGEIVKILWMDNYSEICATCHQGKLNNSIKDDMIPFDLLSTKTANTLKNNHIYNIKDLKDLDSQGKILRLRSCGIKTTNTIITLRNKYFSPIQLLYVPVHRIDNKHKKCKKNIINKRPNKIYTNLYFCIVNNIHRRFKTDYGETLIDVKEDYPLIYAKMIKENNPNNKGAQ